MRNAYWYHTIVRRVAQAYPDLRARKDAMQGQSVTANYSGEPRAREPTRSAENAALRQLAPAEEEALEAVERALERVRLWPDGERYEDLLRAYYFRKEGRLLDCADRRYISERQARNSNKAFLRFIAQAMRLRD